MLLTNSTRNLLSRSTELLVEREAWLREHSTGWTIIYEIWSLKERCLAFEVQIPILDEDVETLLLEGLSQPCSGPDNLLRDPYILMSVSDFSFKFPVTISSDLKRILILSSFVALEDSESAHRSEKIAFDRVQPLGIRPCMINNQFLRRKQNINLFSGVSVFSLCGSHLLFTRPSQEKASPGCTSWDILVFSDLRDTGNQGAAKPPSAILTLSLP